ncbi:hypothetical protein GGI23_003188, partial [Coemansia sp. RSA 2559]
MLHSKPHSTCSSHHSTHRHWTLDALGKLPSAVVVVVVVRIRPEEARIRPDEKASMRFEGEVVRIRQVLHSPAEEEDIPGDDAEADSPCLGSSRPLLLSNDIPWEVYLKTKAK